MVFAGTDDYGVIMSSDFGETWYSLGIDTTAIDVSALKIYKNYLFAGCIFKGTRKLPLDLLGITSVKNVSQILKDPFLYQNYPNPFNPTTIIKYDVPKSSLVTIKVYDILGRIVKTLVNEEKIPGSYEVTFNAQNLSSGIYFYTIKAGDFVQAKKMILLK